ncbi:MULTISPECIES: HEXXH motif domain-containing protein [unclassified Streptomyces]|uniref:HEXXH motif domain-containing protein n=1 Tax=unclassified Streptomyces TaxID=2593676 RepID=UPI0013E054B7|nr:MULTISPECIES: HEXXH motif domain-containing protein [unclassified Streptomyces]
MADLDAVAAGQVGAGTAGRLNLGERSRRMLMLRGVTAAVVAAGDPGPLPPVTDAVALLLRAEAADARVVSEILTHPAVGVWAVDLLARLRSGEPPDVPGGRPLWQDTGYLHALAGVAAVRAGVDALVRVPARAGTVCLPTLGRAEFPGPHMEYATAVLETAPDTGATLTLGTRLIRLSEEPASPGGRWHPVRTVHLPPGGGEGPHAFVLDDCDPYRDFRELHSARPPLTGAEEETWRRLLEEAGRLLAARHPGTAGLLSFALRTLAPLPRTPRFRAESASYSEAVGGVVLSEPHDATELAATLVHEARHSVLNSLVHQVGLFRRPDPREPLLYAPWRSDPRPTAGLVHGVYSFAGVADFWRVERHALSGRRADLAHFEFAVWRDAVAQALRSLSEPGPQARLTDWGRRFVARLAAWTAPWAGEPVPSHPLALARAESADLRITWRLHHLRPHPDEVRELAERWRSGRPARGVDGGAEPAVRASDGGRGEPRGELRRVLLADGSLTAADAAGDRRPELLAADHDLVGGDVAGALRGYQAVLADDPGAHPAWAGLALALHAADAGAATPCLHARPELVRALALELQADGTSPVDPVKLCTWLSE